jgi:hypothetical protein
MRPHDRALLAAVRLASGSPVARAFVAAYVVLVHAWLLFLCMGALWRTMRTAATARMLERGRLSRLLVVAEGLGVLAASEEASEAGAASRGGGDCSSSSKRLDSTRPFNRLSTLAVSFSL